jgi:hypothetical protein
MEREKGVGREGGRERGVAVSLVFGVSALLS